MNASRDSGDANLEKSTSKANLRICDDIPKEQDFLHDSLETSVVQRKDQPHPLEIQFGETASTSADSDIPGVGAIQELFDDNVLSDIEEEVGCPLPSTPVDENALVSEISDAFKAVVLPNTIDLTSLAQNTTEGNENDSRICESPWQVCHVNTIPLWMRDNDFLVNGYRPPLPSLYACFLSIFRLHTETANIWTHLLGCVAFIAAACYFLTITSEVLQFAEKLVLSAFFLGVILCFGLSCAYHTLHCHSEWMGRIFSKLDYCGIAFLIMGSFVPWLYYGFYCQFHITLIYLCVVLCLGIASIVVSLWDWFSEPRFRPLRAGLFLAFGLSGIIPAVHYGISRGWWNAVSETAVHWLIVMGALYVIGAMFYALRIPERFFPGMCDIWFQSHQIFHVLVIAGACVHYHSITEMAMNRLTCADCSNVNL